MANVSLVHNVRKHIGKQYLYKNTYCSSTPSFLFDIVFLRLLFEVHFSPELTKTYMYKYLFLNIIKLLWCTKMQYVPTWHHFNSILDNFALH